MKPGKTLLAAVLLASTTAVTAVSSPAPGATPWLDQIISSASASDRPMPTQRERRRRAPNYPDYSDQPISDMQRMMDYMRREQARLARDMQRLQQDMDREMQRTTSGDRQSMHMEANVSIPAVQIDEDEKNYLVTVNMPNADKKSIKLKLEGSILSIGASQKTQQRKKGDHMYMSQSFRSSVTRSLTLPGPVQQTGMAADYKDGKLLIKVPKALKPGG